MSFDLLLSIVPGAFRSIANQKLQIQNVLVSSVGQHSLDPLLIAFAHHYIDIEMSLSLIRFFGQDVTRMRVATLDLATCSRAKSLRRASMRF